MKEKKIRKERKLWSLEERILYLIFIVGHSEVFNENQIEETVFEKMSEYIKSTTKVECCTYHNRMKQKYKNYESIVKNLSQELKVNS